jgi:Amidohydrolase
MPNDLSPTTHNHLLQRFGAMSEPAELIDAYVHVGLPRFQNVRHYRPMMSRAGITRAVLCSFDSSPDLAAIHAAFTGSPDRFRGLGVPLGRDRAEILAAAEAQLSAGFAGLRLSDADVTDRPWLLDLLAERRGIAVVCGRASSPACARGILTYLERHSDATVVGGHFAGADDPASAIQGPAADLFAHPRFFVVFSRQGAYASSAIRSWAEAVIARTGWQRVMWGSEAPVLFWRNETIEDAIVWINQLSPAPEERDRFFRGNAHRLYFDRPVRVGPLELPFAPGERARPFPATMWARGLPIDQCVAGRLVSAWLAAGGEGRLGTFLERVLDHALPPLPDAWHEDS